MSISLDPFFANPELLFSPLRSQHSFELQQHTLKVPSTTIPLSLAYDDGSFERTEKQLDFIRESLDKNQNLTEKMSHILHECETRFSQLDKTVEPIRGVTDRYRHVYENIEQTLYHVNKILDIFETGNKVEQKIKEGAKGDFDTYFKCLDNVNDALTFIGRNRNFKNSTKVFAQLKVLRHMAMVECEQSFNALITKNSVAIDPTKLPQPLPDKLDLIPQNQIDLMKQLGTRLDQLQSTKYLQDYSDKRSKFLEGSINKLGIDKMIERNTTGGLGIKYLKGSHPYLIFISFLVKGLQYERNLATTLVGLRFFDTTFLTVIHASLETFVDTGESVLKLKRSTDRVFGIFALLDIWERFRLNRTALESVLKLEVSSPFNDIGDLISKLTLNCKKCFEEFEEFVVQKEEGRGILSKHKSGLTDDGSVHELTTLSIQYLNQLLSYKTAAEELLESVAQKPAKSSNPRLTDFIDRTLRGLQMTLEGRAKLEKKMPQLGNIFLLNNHHFILGSIRSSELLGFVDSTLLGSLEQVMDHSKSNYRQSWNKTLEYLMEINKVQTSKTRAFNSSEKSVIKSKFKGFNTAIEDLFHSQKQFRIPDPDLRRNLTNEIKSSIVPLYATFLERYGSLPFSKNRGKYVRYSSETLESLLDRFFEPAPPVSSNPACVNRSLTSSSSSKRSSTVGLAPVTATSSSTSGPSQPSTSTSTSSSSSRRSSSASLSPVSASSLSSSSSSSKRSSAVIAPVSASSSSSSSSSSTKRS